MDSFLPHTHGHPLLPLGFDTHEEAHTFIEDACNHEALSWVRRSVWSSQGLVILGPKGSGKTHLGLLWKKLSGAHLVRVQHFFNPQHADKKKGEGVWDFQQFLESQNQPLAKHSHQTYDLFIDDVEEWFTSYARATQLLHIVNSVRERGGRVLLTGSPPLWGEEGGLPDLTSRLKAMTTVSLKVPSEDFFTKVLACLFRKVDMCVSDEVLTFLCYRVERSLSYAAQLVHSLSTRGLAEGKRLTLPFLRAQMAEMKSVG